MPILKLSTTTGQVGVILGGCLGHAICTGGAVLAGALIARFISIRKITFLGALVFLGFAIASIFIDPNEDGIDGIPDIMVGKAAYI